MADMHQVWEDEKAFNLQHGVAMFEWSQVERIMAFWLSCLAKIPDETAYWILFTVNSTEARIALIKEAIKHSDMKPEYLEFIKLAIKRARQYKGIRNDLAHGASYYDLDHTSGKHKQFYVKQFQSERKITKEMLDFATANFAILWQTMLRVYFHATLPSPASPPGKYIDPKLPSKYLEQVRMLPPDPTLRPPALIVQSPTEFVEEDSGG